MDFTNPIMNNSKNLNKTSTEFDDDHSKIQKISFVANNVATDILICDYNDKQLLVITQYQKLGTFILASKGQAHNLSGTDNIYDVKTISGLDNQDYHLAARYLAEQLNIIKPVLFSICLKDNSLITLKAIVNVLKGKNIF